MFKNKHNRHIDDHKNNPKLLVLYKTKTSLFEFTTIDFEAPPSDKGLTPTRRPLPQFKDTNPHKIHILTSFHGLVCLGTIKDKHDLEYSDLILWNPLTNEYKRLSKSDSHKECNNISLSSSDFGLYYSCCEDDYKLVFVNYEVINVYIYSLKTDSWRKVDDVSQHTSILHPGSWSTGGTYLNENIYFLQQHLDERVGSIIRFDTKTERLSNIETSNVDANPDTSDYFATIMVKSDCIHVCVMYDDIDISGFERTCIKLWKLDEYGNVKEVVSYQLGPPQVYDIPISSLIPFHFTKNGNWLTRNLYTQEFYEVDLKKEMRGNIYDDFEYRKVGVDDNTKNKKIFDKEVRYIETFVSPNPYMK